MSFWTVLARPNSNVFASMAFCSISLILSGCQFELPNAYVYSENDEVDFQLDLKSPKGATISDVMIDESQWGLVQIEDEQTLSFSYAPSLALLGLTASSLNEAIIEKETLAYTVTYSDGSVKEGDVFIKNQIGSTIVSEDSRPLNTLSMKGTHNSYHVGPPLLFHPSHAYSHPALYEQLDRDGVRAFELDVHKSPFTGQFEVYHIQGVDEVSTCYTLERCLDQLKLWSDHNKDHEPVFIWLEVKDFTGGAKILDLDSLDAFLFTQMGEKLLSPDEFKQSYSDVRERIETVGWPTVDESRGKFIFVLLNGSDYMESYTYGLQDIDGRAMFPRVEEEQFTSGWAAFAKGSVIDDEEMALAKSLGIMTAANACSASTNAEKCAMQLSAGKSAGINMIKTDDSRLVF